MGVNGLWKTVEPSGEHGSIIKLAIGHNHSGTICLGVDISILLESCAAALRNAGVHRQGAENPSLKIFFYQLCQFSKAPVVLVFVFDGPHRPAIKRDKRVVHHPIPLLEHVKRLITAFGYYFYEAPAEAEAELAQLNALGYIQGILTEDSDAFVFGARCVIRTTGPTVNHACKIFTSDRIEHTPSVRLSGEGLLLFALLSGGDYSSGLARFGPRLSHKLAVGGFGKQLVELLTTLSGERLRLALNTWRNELRVQLKTNSAGLLPRRYANLAALLPDSFPNVAIAERYLKPLTSWSLEYSGPEPDTLWLPREPHIWSLTRFCMDKFGWSDSGDASTGILKRFHRNLWAGVAQRMLSSPDVVYNQITKTFTSPSIDGMQLIQIYDKPWADKHETNVSFLRLRICATDFVRSMGLPGLHDPSSEALLVRIPAAVLTRAMLGPVIQGVVQEHGSSIMQVRSDTIDLTSDTEGSTTDLSLYRGDYAPLVHLGVVDISSDDEE